MAMGLEVTGYRLKGRIEGRRDKSVLDRRPDDLPSGAPAVCPNRGEELQAPRTRSNYVVVITTLLAPVYRPFDREPDWNYGYLWENPPENVKRGLLVWFERTTGLDYHEVADGLLDIVAGERW